MKAWTVWTKYGNFVKVKAEKIQRLEIDNKPVKILFTTKDLVVAEFYTDKICGWTQDEE